jgi:aspartyl protease family protein
MNFGFDGQQGLILVDVRVDGPVGSRYMRLALDTGATSTLINVDRLVALGYNPSTATDRSRIITGSGVESVARISVDRMAALGKERTGFVVVAHTLPATAGVDGLLGLDFLRERQLCLDFGKGQIELS